MENKEFSKFNLYGFLVILFFSILGFIASFALTVETIKVKEDPNAHLICSVNSVINCASVMKSKEAEVLGFPNSILGIAGFTAIGAFALSFIALKKFDRKLLLVIYAGVLLEFIFSNWLIYISVFKLGQLCPYCLMSFASGTIMFFTFTLIFLKDNLFNFSKEFSGKINKFIDSKWYVPFLGMYYFLVVAAIILKIYR